MAISAEAMRSQMWQALHTLGVDNHRGTGPECPHRPDQADGAALVPMPANWRDPSDGMIKATTTCALLCRLCCVLFWQTGGRLPRADAREHDDVRETALFGGAT